MPLNTDTCKFQTYNVINSLIMKKSHHFLQVLEQFYRLKNNNYKTDAIKDVGKKNLRKISRKLYLKNHCNYH